ncbi:MAG: hypothetical protein AAGM22_29480 [Acidobacteriota bacterium]
MPRLLFLLILASLAPVGAFAQDPDAPSGTIAYFAGDTCPTDWQADTSSIDGFLFLATEDSQDVGDNGRDPLGDQEDRTHDHCVEAVVDINKKNMEGQKGGTGSSVGKKGDYQAVSTSDSSTSGLPFAQVLTCIRE